MSAMSASSPPAGLMPLSLISEHKTAVPGVQALQRTPEKVNQTPQQPLVVSPPSSLPVDQQPLTVKAPPPSVGVANGMEVPATQAPVQYPHQPQDLAHQAISMKVPGHALPPSAHLPNLPSGGLSESPAPLSSEAATSQGGNTVAAVPESHPVTPEPSKPESIRLPSTPGLTITPIGGAPPAAAPPPMASPAPPTIEPPQVQSLPPPSSSTPQAASENAANVPAERPNEPEVKKSEKPSPVEPVAEKPKTASTENVSSSNSAAPTPAPPVTTAPAPAPVAKDLSTSAPKPTPTPAPAPTPAPVDQPTAAATPEPAAASAAPKTTPPLVTQTTPSSTQASSPVKEPQTVKEPTAAPAVKEASSSEKPPATKPEAAAPAPPAAATAPVLPSTPAPEPVAQSKVKRTPKPKPTPDVEKKTPAKETPSDKDEDGKPRRKRLPTQPYQSPIPELNIIAKISKIVKTPVKPQEDKLIVFYKNEFLAVRNAEGSYYVCQAMQNIYKTSSKIKIRWLSQESDGENYSPDFYDHTEFDCILTNLNLQRVGKNQFKLPEVEAKRTDSILKRAIDVEKGIVAADESTITEEHPDGLDLSLFRNEEQLKKRKKDKSAGVSTPKSARSKRLKPARPATEPVKKLTSRNSAAAKRKSTASTPVTSRRAVASSARKPSPTSSSASSSTSSKKETPKKDVTTPVAKSAAKRKPAPASAPPADIKRSRRDPTTKTKSGAAAASPSGASTPKPSASSTSRRPTRNAK